VITYLTYVSSATRLLPVERLRGLLDQARSNNDRDGLTGLLLYRDGNFMQTIEGPEAAIARLLSRLEVDPRHTGLSVLLSGEREDRRFDEWSMGFCDLGDAVVRDMPGFSEFLNTPLTTDAFGESPSASERLLLVFKRNMR
jgi:Sensors of blue-light using FAD